MKTSMGRYSSVAPDMRVEKVWLQSFLKEKALIMRSISDSADIA